MNKQQEQPEKPEKSDLEEAAYDAVLKGVVLPREGTEAYDSVKQTCEDYSSVVAQEMVSKSPIFLTTSEKKRRSLHNKLCVQLFGTSWMDTAPHNRDAASRFAHYVAGRPDFADGPGH